jgi:hypothetical protein
MANHVRSDRAFTDSRRSLEGIDESLKQATVKPRDLSESQLSCGERAIRTRRWRKARVGGR